MDNQVTLTRDVTTEECDWLDRDYLKGEKLFRYDGFTYGVIGEDGVAVSEESQVLPFFEIPRDAIQMEDD